MILPLIFNKKKHNIKNPVIEFHHTLHLCYKNKDENRLGQINCIFEQECRTLSHETSILQHR